VTPCPYKLSHTERPRSRGWPACAPYSCRSRGPAHGPMYSSSEAVPSPGMAFCSRQPRRVAWLWLPSLRVAGGAARDQGLDSHHSPQLEGVALHGPQLPRHHSRPYQSVSLRYRDRSTSESIVSRTRVWVSLAASEIWATYSSPQLYLAPSVLDPAHRSGEPTYLCLEWTPVLCQRRSVAISRPVCVSGLRGQRPVR
jgi:hypothetical protein